jgi:BMFP domain-containing protein YqiC
MTQTTNRFLDDFAKLMTDAAGAADGLRREAEQIFRTQGEKFLAGLDVVRREEFEAVKAMAEKARTENEALEARIAALEAQLQRAGGA